LTRDSYGLPAFEDGPLELFKPFECFCFLLLLVLGNVLITLFRDESENTVLDPEEKDKRL